MEIALYNQQAEKIGTLNLEDSLYALSPNQHLMAEAVRVQLSNARVGLANTKTRGEVSGGGRKPHKQKGTGKARAGSNRSPIWRHGGITFGPRSNRNWSLKINKKAKSKALFMALSDKVKNNKLIILDSLDFPEIKTKNFLEVINKFGSVSPEIQQKALLVTSSKQNTVAKSARNIENMEISATKSLNLVDVLSSKVILLTKADVEIINQVYGQRLAKSKKINVE